GDGGGGVLRRGGAAAAETRLLVGPRTAPLRLAPGADLRRRRRFIAAPEAAIRGAEKLQRVAFAGIRGDEPFEQTGGALVLVTLQIDARPPDPPPSIPPLH